MLSLTKKTDYGLVALAYLAQCFDAELEAERISDQNQKDEPNKQPVSNHADAAAIVTNQTIDPNQPTPGPVSARQISKRYNLPLPLLMNILKELNQAKLVNSKRGAQGGYSLARDPHQITILEVITALEGPLQFAQCACSIPVFGQATCEVHDNSVGGCPIRGPIQRLHYRIQNVLSNTSVADLIPKHGTDQDAEDEFNQQLVQDLANDPSSISLTLANAFE